MTYEVTKRDLEMAASLMDEASDLLAAVNPDVLEKLPNYRWPLVDELGGAASILRDRYAAPSSPQPPAPDTSAEDALWHGYAGKAMQALVEDAPYELCWARYAEDAADMADAMLTEARKRGRV